MRPSELKLVPVALEGSAFRSKFLDIDELMTYCSWFAVITAMLKYYSVSACTSSSFQITNLSFECEGIQKKREQNFYFEEVNMLKHEIKRARSKRTF